MLPREAELSAYMAGGRLNDVGLRNVETMEIIGSVLNRKGSNTRHVDNNQFYGMECMSA